MTSVPERRPRPIRIACDSLVAVGAATADGSTLFAKNSDRPARECQPLTLIEASRHENDVPLRCQYIELPPVEHTLRILGSRPFWLWGLEHGVNEAGVAIGNHTVFTRDKPEGKKLIGMDLVRLGLERGATAQAAADVICRLVETHGQGGSGYHDSDFPYHSSFLVADSQGALLIETSDRHWVSKEISSVGSATNHTTIGRDWDALSPDVVEHARASGWWQGGDAEFDFAAAYRDASWVPPTFSSGRYRRSCEVLAAGHGTIGESTMRAALRDHYDGPVFRGAYPADDERHLSLCMHADPIGATTASVVVRLPRDRRPVRYWASLGPPCVGVFLPLYPAAALPPALARGSGDPDPTSPWWLFRGLLEKVEQDPATRGVAVRQSWDELERQFAEAADHIESEIDPDDPTRSARLGVFAQDCVDQALDRLRQIDASLG